jgi:parallel beta-helix repeat protein
MTAAWISLPLIAMSIWSTVARPSESEAPCLRPSRAGTQVQGDVRVCPGHYRIADPAERGVIVVAASGTRIELTGVTLESGDSVPAGYNGIGIMSKGVDGVTIVGGAIRGYRFGIRIEGGRGHRVVGIDASGSRAQRLASTSERADTSDRLDVDHLATIDAYGSGVLLKGTVGASVTGVISRGAQNGISLLDSRDSYISDNDVSGNTGWAIQLWHSSHNAIIRNNATLTRRCEQRGGCDAASVLLREGSDSNTFSDNDLSGSSVGVIIAGEPPLSHASIGNLFHRNDASQALECGFLVRHTWATTLLENRADSSGFGFRLVRVSGTTLRGNTVIGSRDAGISASQGGDNGLQQNVLLGGRVAIEVLATDSAAPPGRGYVIDDNIIGGVSRGIVLKGVARSRIRGNVIDGVDDALVIDAAGYATEVSGNVFLRATGAYIVAPDLAAGGNYWSTADAAAAAARVRGRVSVLPWKPASAAGY